MSELLGAMGIEGEFTPVPVDQALTEFKTLADATSLPSAVLVRLRAVKKDGQQLLGLLVMTGNHNES